jgi:signal transduction histidine kinase
MTAQNDSKMDMKQNAHKITEMTRSGLNLIKQAISIYDQDLVLMVANTKFKTMFSLPDKLTEVGASFAETISYLAAKGEYGPIDDEEIFVYERVEQAKAFVPHYIERQRANGTTIAVEGRPLRQGGWVTVYTDITDIRRQEEMLRDSSKDLSARLLKRSEELAQTNRELSATIIALEEAKQELMDSEMRLNATNAMTPAHIARVDTAGHYTYTNEKLHTVVPGRPKNILGMHLNDALGDEAYAAIRPKFSDAMAGNASVLEFPLKQSGKQIRVAFTPDVDTSGEIVGAYLLSMDITEETNARQALMHTRRRELAAQLTSGLAHDFANLLTIILGQQSKLETLTDLPSQAREIVATTKDATLRGGALLSGLGQINATRNLSLRAVDFNSLIDKASRLIRAAITDKIEFTVDNKIVDEKLMLDGGFMQDALLNLALNAKEAIQGSGKITLTVNHPHPDWLELIMIDSGPGFSEAALKNAFTPFYTTKKGKIGRGLGLSMVYDFAKMNGGRVIADNHPDGGAEITLRIPYKKARPVTTGLALLVEDNLTIRETIRDYLQCLGYSVLEADSAEEAARLAALPDLTLIVSDLMLRGEMTGFDFAKAIRAMGVAIPILIVTGLPPNDPIHQRASADFTVLTKPFTSDTLASHIQSEVL